MQRAGIVIFERKGRGYPIAVNPGHVLVAYEAGEPNLTTLEMVELYRSDRPHKAVTVKGSLVEVVHQLNRALAASVTIVNDGSCAITVEARGDSPSKEPPVLEPGDSRHIQILGDLHVKIAAEDQD